jgi:hypothetical protein
MSSRPDVDRIPQWVHRYLRTPLRLTGAGRGYTESAHGSNADGPRPNTKPRAYSPDRRLAHRPASGRNTVQPTSENPVPRPFWEECAALAMHGGSLSRVRGHQSCPER